MTNANEGLTRIAKVIRWLGVGFSVVLILIGIYDAVTSYNAWDNNWYQTLLIVLGVIVFIMGSSHGLAWIIEGFAKPK